MTNSSDIYNAYNKFYANMRNYIWDYKTVDLLAELEIGIYHRFPDIQEVRKVLEKLKSKIDKTMEDDDDFKKAYDKLSRVLSVSDMVYANIHNINYR